MNERRLTAVVREQMWKAVEEEKFRPTLHGATLTCFHAGPRMGQHEVCSGWVFPADGRRRCCDCPCHDVAGRWVFERAMHRAIGTRDSLEPGATVRVRGQEIVLGDWRKEELWER